jgi:hypothetical protein
MRMRVCYRDCHEAGLCCYLVIHIEDLLRPYVTDLLTLPLSINPTRWSHCIGCSGKNGVFISHIPRSCYISRPSHLPTFHHSRNVRYRVNYIIFARSFIHAFAFAGGYLKQSHMLLKEKLRHVKSRRKQTTSYRSNVFSASTKTVLFVLYWGVCEEVTEYEVDFETSLYGLCLSYSLTSDLIHTLHYI